MDTNRKREQENGEAGGAVVNVAAVRPARGPTHGALLQEGAIDFVAIRPSWSTKTIERLVEMVADDNNRLLEVLTQRQHCMAVASIDARPKR